MRVWWAEAKKVELMGQEFPWALNKVGQILCEEEPSVLVRLRERLPERVREVGHEQSRRVHLLMARVKHRVE